jgi:hypothetical protein
MRRGLKIVTAVAAVSTLGLAPAAGAIQQRTLASGKSPFEADCNTQPQTGTLYLNSEVEPWLDVDPTSPVNRPRFIGVYQQDRYSDGGARGLGTTVSTDVGRVSPHWASPSSQSSPSVRATSSTSARRIHG